MGTFGRPHGIKGEISLRWHGESSPVAGLRLYLSDGSQLILRGVREHKEGFLVSLDGLADRTAVEPLAGQSVFQHRNELLTPARDEAFFADLPGCEVFLDDGKALGVLDHLEFVPGQVLWSIKSANGHEILFPAQPEFVVSLEPADKKVVISPPPGLLEVYNA